MKYLFTIFAALAVYLSSSFLASTFAQFGPIGEPGEQAARGGYAISLHLQGKGHLYSQQLLTYYRSQSRRQFYSRDERQTNLSEKTKASRYKNPLACVCALSKLNVDSKFNVDVQTRVQVVRTFETLEAATDECAEIVEGEFETTDDDGNKEIATPLTCKVLAVPEKKSSKS